MLRFVAVGLAAFSLALDPAPAAAPSGPSPAPSDARLPDRPRMSEDELGRLRQAIDAARERPQAAQDVTATLADPVARKLVDWFRAEAGADRVPVAELEALAARLQGWPGSAGRERSLARRRAAELPAGPRPYAALSGEDNQRAARYRQARSRMGQALRRGQPAAAYAAISTHGQEPGSVAYAESESFAGWLALNKLGDLAAADRHFSRLDAAVRSPVSKARAAYWRGRTAERAGDMARARQFYEAGAAHITTFYGQLAAQKAGHRELVLAPDPRPTPAERAAFESEEITRAIRLLAAVGERSALRTFALETGARARSPSELLLLVDMLQSLGEQEVSLLAYRRGARLGHILHERGYPVLAPPAVPGAAEPAFVLAVVRQESQFDPRVRSRADARGMMQILPSTGRLVARQIGVAWTDDALWDPHVNMRLGSRYLGDLSREFGGSYVMAAAGYNAGPGRPAAWIGYCGDPRAPGADPLDFIECIPFGETRDYVMNVMANFQMYRARLNGGRAALTPAEDLRAGMSSVAPTDAAARHPGSRAASP